MPDYLLQVTGRDPLLFRDGRPFGAEPGALQARTLPVPMPSTLAGVLRTYVGEQSGWDWQGDGPARALEVAVAGPLLLCGGRAVFPAPADALREAPAPGEAGGTPAVPGMGVGGPAAAAERVHRLRPQEPEAGAGCDLPAGLWPVSPLGSEPVGKPAAGRAWWVWSDLEAWLAAGDDEAVPQGQQAHAGPPKEERTHVRVDPSTGAVGDTRDSSGLFTTQGVVFESLNEAGQVTRWSLLARVRTRDGVRTDRCLAPVGGERRLAWIEEAGSGAGWPDPGPCLKHRLAAAQRVRLVLATPAVFAGGWRPGWLDAEGMGSPPGVEGLRLQLVGAAVPRREAVSGWDYQRHGPKAVRWLAAAGSVYFFEVVEGDPGTLAGAGWLEPVSDAEEDRRDGFGLALWGIWGENRAGPEPQLVHDGGMAGAGGGAAVLEAPEAGGTPAVPGGGAPTVPEAGGTPAVPGGGAPMVPEVGDARRDLRNRGSGPGKPPAGRPVKKKPRR